ncbi:MAG: ATP-binding protein [Mesorhizobium sp.]|nr:MAG: ATP-binding protein [Mesorhizobium sp.]
MATSPRRRPSGMAKFRVRARTIDMLGRQQIAGIPTAISELFKNAHDAYATRVEVDYFRDDGLFVLRDDGLGMTREDFEQRWLTLGTDSKLNAAAGLKPPPVDPAQLSRPILGEKGIGRLAIAVIGPQVLVLTRAKSNGKAQDYLTGAYIHWGLFEIPGIDLDEITIPIETFPVPHLPGAPEVARMVSAVRSTLASLKARIDDALFEKISAEMEQFKVDPSDIATYLDDPGFKGDGCGTHFYIKPADPIIENDIDSRDHEFKATRFEKHLIGFTNTMTVTEKGPPPIVARFRDYLDEGAPVERIGDLAFFTPQEFTEVDHHISGEFDEYGQFRGDVGIYHLPPDRYVLNWSDGDGNPTQCGPFKISFAVLQGNIKDTLVPPQDYAALSRKLAKHGGLYIYKDGIRVQPYGDSDYDFLDIEKRRTLGAAYYYYSYRRMMGVIDLDGEKNRELTEKAGREGFRENKAYRQFRSILMNFFLQTAADYFREEGKYSEKYGEKKDELNRNAELRQKKAKQATSKKRVFQAKLAKFFEDLDGRRTEARVEEIITDLRGKASEISGSRRSSASKALALMRVEKEGRDQLTLLRDELTISKPRGVGLGRALTNEWLAYQTEQGRIEHEVIEKAEKAIEDTVSSEAREYSIALDTFARFDGALRNQVTNVREQIRSSKSETEDGLNLLIKQCRQTVTDSFRAVNKAADDMLVEIESLKASGISEDDLASKRLLFENRFSDVHQREEATLSRLRDQINSFLGFWDEDGFDSVDLTEALEEELVELRDRRGVELELAQVGLALNTINHEFEKTVSALRSGFRRLASWAEVNPDLRRLYEEMRSSFDHLDGYLEMFTPLDRRLNRDKTEISGKDIFDFLNSLFEVRFSRHSVELLATDEFRNKSFHGHTSVFYPVFVNLVDNAIFWLQGKRGSPRTIELDVDGDDLIIRDNGPGVSPRDRENIFALNFTRKPGGRGMGLYISRETLAKEGYSLSLDKTDEGAAFRISNKTEGNKG